MSIKGLWQTMTGRTCVPLRWSVPWNDPDTTVLADGSEGCFPWSSVISRVIAVHVLLCHTFGGFTRVIILEQSSGRKISLYQTRVLSPCDVNLMFTVCLSLSRSNVISTQNQSSTFHISFCSGRAVSGSFHGPGCSIVYYESITRELKWRLIFEYRCDED